jgi:hypothetical protein
VARQERSELGEVDVVAIVAHGGSGEEVGGALAEAAHSSINIDHAHQLTVVLRLCIAKDVELLFL